MTQIVSPRLNYGSNSPFNANLSQRLFSSESNVNRANVYSPGGNVSSEIGMPSAGVVHGSGQRGKGWGFWGIGQRQRVAT